MVLTRQQSFLLPAVGGQMDFLEEIRSRGGGGLVSINDPANQRKRSSATAPPAEQDKDLLNVLAMGFNKIKAQKNMSSDESESESGDSTDNWSDEDC